MSEQAKRMSALFAGARTAHGRHGITKQKGVKVDIKPTATTVRKPVTEQVWEEHLSGKQPLGIVPIDEESTCIFGTIDVDKYDLALKDVVARIKAAGLPLVVLRSKSGGAHVTLFLKERVPAAAIRAKLKEIAARLGWGECEIFPKQDVMLVERGDFGNWINMPYLGGDKSDRHAVKPTGLPMTVDEFLTFAEKSRVRLEDIKVGKAAKARASTTNGTGYKGPVCLEIMEGQGIPEGGRNNAVYNAALMNKRMFPEGWQDATRDWNANFCRPPLDDDEVAGILENVESNPTSYTCKQPPCSTHCDMATCRTREFGIGGEAKNYPRLSNLTMVLSDPPIWFVTLNDDARLELTTDQLTRYSEFQKVAMGHRKVMFPLKSETWLTYVDAAMETLETVEAPPEASVSGQFLELLDEFCTQRGKGDKPEDILQGGAWRDVENSRFCFHLRNFLKYCDKQGFKQWKRNKITAKVIEVGEKDVRVVVKGSKLKVYAVPFKLFEEQPELDTVDMPTAPI